MKTTTMVVAAIAALAAPASGQERIDETFVSDPAGTVRIENVAGSVTVTAWDRNEIRVRGTLGRGTERLELDRSPRSTEIRVILPRNARNVQGSDLEIHVPARKQVSVVGVSADVSVAGVRGAVSARSTSGDVTVSGRPESVRGASTSGDVEVDVVTSGRVEVRSTSGDIEVSGTATEGVSAESVSGDVLVTAATGDLRAKAVSGDVRLQGVRGRVSASTVSGDARLVDGRAQYVSLESVSGNLIYQGEIARGAAFDLKSHSGDIELILPRGSDLGLDVKTFSGSIRSDFGGDVQRTSRYGPGRELQHLVGSGGATLRIQTFSGGVKLERR